MTMYTSTGKPGYKVYLHVILPNNKGHHIAVACRTKLFKAWTQARLNALSEWRKAFGASVDEHVGRITTLYQQGEQKRRLNTRRGVPYPYSDTASVDGTVYHIEVFK